MLVLSNHDQSSNSPKNCPDSYDYHPKRKCHYILLVEDNPTLQMVFSELLRTQLNCEVDIANDGEEAFFLFSYHYDLVVMDIGLPGIDGIEATRKIRKAYQKINTPIIAHTAHGDKDIAQRCFAAGMKAFISKSGSLEALPACIRSILAEEEVH